MNYAQEWEKILARYRPYLVSFAFRLTGSLSDAEDIVQDTFVASAEVDPREISNPKSWLTKVCANKGLDHLKQAYLKREVYPGVWLPDAVPDSFGLGEVMADPRSPESDLIQAESLSMSFLLLAERLTPEERVVYLLSEVFEYSFREIAGFLGKSEAACRKIAERARKSLASDRSRFAKPTLESEKLLVTFFESAKSGDRARLRQLLAEDSELWTDGGGKVPVASKTVLADPDAIAGFFAKLGSAPAFSSEQYKVERSWINSRPGIVISRQLPSGLWCFDTILSFEMRGDRIARIYAQRNPDKLRKLEEVGGPLKATLN